MSAVGKLKELLEAERRTTTLQKPTFRSIEDLVEEIIDELSRGIYLGISDRVREGALDDLISLIYVRLHKLLRQLNEGRIDLEVLLPEERRLINAVMRLKAFEIKPKEEEKLDFFAFLTPFPQIILPTHIRIGPFERGDLVYASRRHMEDLERRGIVVRVKIE